MLITLWCKRVYVCVCVMESGMCVWERERWNQVCLCVCNTESSMCEYVRERETESSVLRVSCREWNLFWHDHGWEWAEVGLAGFPQGKDEAQALEGPSCSTKPMCAGSRRSFLGSGVKQSGCHGGFIFPSRHASSWALGHLCVQTKLGKFRAASWAIVPCFLLTVRRHSEHKNVWSCCSSNNELISGF